MNSPTPDLQRIVEALKACRERYEIGTNFDAYDWWVFDRQEGYRIVTGSLERCQEVFDARRAEAMVRAIVPAELVAMSAGVTPGEIVATGCDFAEIPEDYGDQDNPPYFDRHTMCDDDKAWTISTDANKPGWETDSGLSYYGLSQDNAKFAAAAWNLVRSLSAILGETAPANTEKHDA